MPLGTPWEGRRVGGSQVRIPAATPDGQNPFGEKGYLNQKNAPVGMVYLCFFAFVDDSVYKGIFILLWVVKAVKILVIGGSASGKSAVAERLCVKLGKPAAYIATMQPFGKDAAYRIDRHRKLRAGKGFLTVEQYTDIARAADKLGNQADTLLIECLSNLCANEIFSPEGAGPETESRIAQGIRALGDRYENVIVVTNEIFSDGIAYPRETMDYIQTLGRLNARLARWADGVVEVFCGIPLYRKDPEGRVKGCMET